jgi:hypothetical protein
VEEQTKKPRQEQALATEQQAAERAGRRDGGEEEAGQGAEQDEETRQAAEAERVARFQRLYASMGNILDSSQLQIAEDLPQAQQNALELLFQAKAGEHENSVYAAGIQCMRFLNRSLATLQPALAVALHSDNPVLHKMYTDMQTRVGELRLELRQRIMKEAHKGGRRRGGGNITEQREQELTAMGSLAWELAQLVKKRKRKRFAHDPTEHPVGLALEAMAGGARALGKLAADLARLDAKLAAATDANQRAAVQEHLEFIERRLVELLTGLLASAGDAADEAGQPGAHAPLRERLAPIVKGARLDSLDAALRTARQYVDVAHAAMDDQDAIVAAAKSDGGTKRGIFGSLFGRGKKA